MTGWFVRCCYAGGTLAVEDIVTGAVLRLGVGLALAHTMNVVAAVVIAVLLGVSVAYAMQSTQDGPRR